MLGVILQTTMSYFYAPCSGMGGASVFTPLEGQFEMVRLYLDDLKNCEDPMMRHILFMDKIRLMIIGWMSLSKLGIKQQYANLQQVEERRCTPVMNRCCGADAPEEEDGKSDCCAGGSGGGAKGGETKASERREQAVQVRFTRRCNPTLCSI